MQPTSLEIRAEEYPSAVGYALGYLMAIALLPLLAHGLSLRESLLQALVLLAAIAALRLYQGVVVRGVLSPLRARAVLLHLDLASVLLFLASVLLVWALDARQLGSGWTLLACGALAGLVGCLIMLRQARHKWFSSTLLSRLG